MLAVFFFLTEGTTGFAPRHAGFGGRRLSLTVGEKGAESCSPIVVRRTNSGLSLFEIDADFKPEKKKDDNKTSKKEDPLANFEVGAVVRIVAKGLKAYQVQPKAYGSFDSDKKFVPAPKDGDRTTQSLVLPVGLRGVVSKIYDNEDVSANFPIQVKFVPGEHVDEGFDTPVRFLSHFSPEEIDVVE